MFVSEPLIYLQLPKTATAHIGNVLRESVGGDFHGGHGRGKADWVFKSHQYVLGSIRNPWDWYVSLWAYSCSGQGQLFHRTTRRYPWKRLAYKIRRDRRLTVRHAREFLRHLGRPTDDWRQTYLDPHDREAFRAWLRRMQDPARAYDLTEGFGESALSSYAGLLTFLYARLFCMDVEAVDAPDLLTGRADLREHLASRWGLDGIVNVDNLECDLISAIKRSGVPLSSDQEAWIHGQRRVKKNTSKHGPPATYYDAETADMVASREALIIERHGYDGPATREA